LVAVSTKLSNHCVQEQRQAGVFLTACADAEKRNPIEQQRTTCAII